jgi:segregation and condensation protein B
MADFQHIRLVEALLFASAEAVDEASLRARLPKGVDLAEILAELEQTYVERGINLVRRGERWAFRTAPDLAADLAAETPVTRKLSRAAVETLAIIAYHQPVTRAEIEEIRGVALSKGTLDVLFEAGWVRPRGRRATPGRPMLWITSEEFLDQFGLVGLEDLPGIDDLKAAGLLDVRPGLSTYANRAEDDGEPVDVGEELDEEELERRSMDLLETAKSKQGS